MNTNCPVPMLQHPEEFETLLNLIQEKLRPRLRFLEIGSLHGGTLWHYMQLLDPGGVMVNIDALIPPSDPRYASQKEGHDGLWMKWAKGFGVNSLTLTGTSSDPCIMRCAQGFAAATGGYDFLFIDGAHDYGSVKWDYEKYEPWVRRGGIIAFHDISWTGGDVNRFWREAREGQQFQQIQLHPDPKVMGIGVIFKA